MNLKLNLKVLAEIREDLRRVESQLSFRVRNPEVQAKYREQVMEMQKATELLFLHYKTILEAQIK